MFQCDYGREYDNSSFQFFCHQNGMKFRFSCPHTSSQNGKDERKIRTINNITHTLLLHASMPRSFWHHALAMATYLHNILPTKLLNNFSPTQILYNKNPSFHHLRVFGCLCYPLFPSTTIHKLQARSTPCVLLGYPSNHQGYKCLDLSNKKIFISRHVIFYESVFLFTTLHKPSASDYDFLGSNFPISLFPKLGHSVSPQPAQFSSPSRPTSLAPAHMTSPSPGPVSPGLTSQVHIASSSVDSTGQSISTVSSSPSSRPSQHISSSGSMLRFGSLPPSPIQPIPNRVVSTHPMATRAQHGIFKPRKPQNLSTITTPSHVPCNPK